MYDRADVPRVARRQTESLPGRNPEDGVRRADEFSFGHLAERLLPIYRSIARERQAPALRARG